MKTRRDPSYYLEALRGRVLLVFSEQVHWADDGSVCHFGVNTSDIARELGVSRQAVYRAFPELTRPKAH
jgi:hypothetical protein